MLSLTALVLSISLQAQAGTPTTDVEKLRKQLEKVDSFSPAEYHQTMVLLEKIGPEAATPHLIPLLKDRASKAERKVSFGCEAIARFGTVAALESVESWLDERTFLIRSCCSGAYGKLLADESVSEEVRKKGANRLFKMVQEELTARQPQTAIGVADGLGWVIFDAEGAHETMNQWAEKGDYWTRKIGLTSMFKRQKYHNIAGEIAVNVLKDATVDPSVKESAIRVIIDLKVYGARDTLRSIASAPKDPGGNLLAVTYEAMGVVGDKEDLSVLKKGIKRDPAGAGGYMAVRAKESIKAIESRLTMDEKGEL